MDAGRNDCGECYFLGQWRIECVDNLHLQSDGLQHNGRLPSVKSSLGHNARIVTDANAHADTNPDAHTNSDTNPHTNTDADTASGCAH